MITETAEPFCRALERLLHDLSFQSYESDAAAQQGPSPSRYPRATSQIPSAQHQPVFRVMSEDSPDGNSASDLLPRCWPLPNLPRRKLIKRLLQSHGERKRTPTPF